MLAPWRAVERRVEETLRHDLPRIVVKLQCKAPHARLLVAAVALGVRADGVLSRGACVHDTWRCRQMTMGAIVRVLLRLAGRKFC
jgi:hypothetical protein